MLNIQAKLKNSYLLQNEDLQMQRSNSENLAAENHST